MWAEVCTELFADVALSVGLEFRFFLSGFCLPVFISLTAELLEDG